MAVSTQVRQIGTVALQALLRGPSPQEVTRLRLHKSLRAARANLLRWDSSLRAFCVETILLTVLRGNPGSAPARSWYEWMQISERSE